MELRVKFAHENNIIAKSTKYATLVSSGRAVFNECIMVYDAFSTEKLKRLKSPHRCTRCDSQQPCRSNNAQGSEDSDMRRSMFNTYRRQDKRCPKAGDSNEINPAPTVTEVWNIPLSFIVLLFQAQAKGQVDEIRLF